MQWLASVCVRRPVFAGVLMLLLLVLGIAGYTRLGVDQFPNIDFPIVVVMTRLEGAAPAEVESEVTNKIEDAVNTISGIDELRSTSSEGVSIVIIGFALEKNSDVGAQEVRDKVNQVLPKLPRGIDQPIVSRIDPDAIGVLQIAVHAKGSIVEVTELADKEVKRRIESLPGVGQVEILGGRTRQILVHLDSAKLRAFSLSAVDVHRALAAQNLSAPGGSVETGPERTTIRVEGRVSKVEELERIVVKEGAARSIRVGDVATVEDSAEEEKTFAAVDGERTVVLSVKKQSGKNTVAVVDTVAARLKEVEGALRGRARLEIIRDNSGVIRTGIHAVEEHLVVGAVLAALVVLFFLGNIRTTIIAAVSIPISIIGTFAVMWLAGYTLNFLTLLALALSVGIVIDDAIVVLENIVRWVDEKGVKPFPASILATREIGLAVLATTLSLMAVFLPVAAMPGIVGRFLTSFGLTMAFSIAVSMLVSFSLTPMLAARWLPPKGAEKGLIDRFFGRVVDAFYKPLERGYLYLLRGAMKRRWIVVVLSVLTLASCGPIAKKLPSGFLPPDDNAQFEIGIRLPESTSLDETKLYGERIANTVRAYPGVAHVIFTAGEGEKAPANQAKIVALLTDPKDRTATQYDLMTRVRTEIVAKAPPDVRMTLQEVAGISVGGQSNANIQYALAGNDLGELERHAAIILDKVRRTPGAVDVDSSLAPGKPELRLLVDRNRAAELGVRMSDVAATVGLFVGGLKATDFAENGEEYEVRVRGKERGLGDANALALLTVPSRTLGQVPLAQLVTFKKAEGLAEIFHLGRRRQVTFFANAAPGAGENVVEAAIKTAVAEEHLPAGYELLPVGRTKEAGRAGGGFILVFALAFIFMYLVLAAQFESWLLPLAILTSLPLTVPFALLSLLVFKQSLNIFSGLGLLVLFGVVKKNAILQISHTNQLRQEGMDRLTAILEANRERLRPILMTTLAFVAGMLPLVFSRGIGAGKNQTTGAIVFGGQTLSLLLTLLAVPVIYSLLDDLSAKAKRLFSRGAPVDRGEAELDAILEAEARGHVEPHSGETVKLQLDLGK